MKWSLVALLVLPACAGPSEAERDAERQRLKQEILAEIREVDPGARPAAEAPATAPAPAMVGEVVEGRLLWGDGGLANARVRLVRMDVFRSKPSVEYRAGDFYDTTTDEEGRFRFPSVEFGSYKCLWAPPGADSWVRRLANNPDAIVQKGQPAAMSEIQTRRHVLNR